MKERRDVGQKVGTVWSMLHIYKMDYLQSAIAVNGP